LVAIFNFDGCEPVLEGDNECDISITVTESNDEGDECEAFSFTYDVGNPDCSIATIRVFGGDDFQDFDDPDGTIETELEAGQGGQQAAISNVRFCATVNGMDDDEMDDDGMDDEMDNVDLQLVSKKDGHKYELEITNGTDHDIKFSWGLDDTRHGGKVTVDGESSETFHVDTDEEGTVYLYHDGDQVDSVDVE